MTCRNLLRHTRASPLLATCVCRRQLRLRHSPPLSTARFLAGISVTAWLYRDKAGVQGIQVNPNTTIEELIRKFGPAETPDAEVGFHSEMGRHKQQSGRDFESRLQLVVRDIRRSFAGWLPWVPPTAPLHQARTTKRLHCWAARPWVSWTN
jgi:hypothetical protein